MSVQFDGGDARAETRDALPNSYAAATQELETILADLDNSEIDVDDLASKVARAAELLRFCEERLTKAERQVNQIVAGLEEDSQALTAAAEDIEETAQAPEIVAD